MKIIIDADGCPVVRETESAAQRHGLSCTAVCDICHMLNLEYAVVITVDKGRDSADLKITSLAAKGDIVVTQDYGLAAMCLAKGAIPLNQDGMVYDSDNIDALLLSRHTAAKIRRSGGRLKGQPKRTKEQDAAFTAALEKLIKNHLL